MSASIPANEEETTCYFPVTRFTIAAMSLAQEMASPAVPGYAVAVLITVIIIPSLR
jgi:hypothetical protein